MPAGAEWGPECRRNRVAVRTVLRDRSPIQVEYAATGFGRRCMGILKEARRLQGRRGEDPRAAGYGAERSAVIVRIRSLVATGGNRRRRGGCGHQGADERGGEQHEAGRGDERRPAGSQHGSIVADRGAVSNRRRPRLERRRANATA